MPANLWTRARGRWVRTAAQTFFRRPITIDNPSPVISFTFDDFPRSAILTGGGILRRFGLRGTYYASLGLMGKQGSTGAFFLPEDLKLAFEQEHELGCHTFEHCDAWVTKTHAFEDSVIENRRALKELVPEASFRTLSYPINLPRLRTKQKVAKYFTCCRGGGQTLNAGQADLNCLSAYFLEKSKGDINDPKRLIDENAKARGWLIFATHDVSASPSAFGCTPDFFEEVVRYAVNSGARVLPVCKACEVLRASSAR